MNNHSGRRAHGPDAVPKSVTMAISSILRGGLEERRRQKLQVTQAYMALFWHSKLRFIVMSEWEKMAEGGAKKDDFIAFMNKRVKELFDKETLEVQAQVDNYRCDKAREEPSLESFLLPGEEKLDTEEQHRRTTARKQQS